MASKHLRRLDKLVVNIEHWRQSKERKSSRMPTELWAEAAALAGQLGIGIVRKRAKLEHSKLKRLCQDQGIPEPLSLATFIELPAPPSAAISCAIEIESRGGRMRATVNGASAEEVASIFRGFVSESCCN